MKQETQNEFREELKILTDKYNIKNVVFGGQCEDKFIGLFGLTPCTNISEIAEIICNAARLYQSGREKLMIYLDRIVKI